MFHPILTNCTDKECENEIGMSKRRLEETLKKSIDSLGYPNGNYSNREIEILKRNKYRSARTLDVGWNNIKTDPYLLKSMCLQDNASINVLCGQVIGLFGYLRYLGKGSFFGKLPQ
jgi:hypothetical protein